MRHQPDFTPFRFYGNPLKGKKLMLAGALCMLLGVGIFIVPLVLFFFGQIQQFSFASNGIAALILIAIGFVFHICGRIVHWYYWR
jgi:uncharacterized membrane protein YfcA